MRTICTAADIKQEVNAQRMRGKRIGLVPTMGNLHDGHLRLVEKAKQASDWVVCSIFVNPMQFGPGEDLDAYPRTLDQDQALLQGHHCDCLFNPGVNEIYPTGLDAQTVVSVPELGTRHCGASRPDHFDGVTTVVNKLFNLCLPDQGFFGLKDYQQFLLIRKMVKDLCIPVTVIGVETVREEDGLAMSSRNNYLTAAERKKAPELYRILNAVGDEIQSGNRDYRSLEKTALEQLQSKELVPDYFTINNGDTLQPADESDRSLAILAAVRLGRSRLIDNVRLSLDER